MDSDLSLINKIKDEKDCASLQELINRHSGIYVDTVNKMIGDTCEFISKRDVLEDKDFFIYSAALKFLPEKNTKFSTYLANDTRWKCLNLYNKKKKMIEEPLDASFEEKASTTDFVIDIEQSEIIARILNSANKHPDIRVKKIIEMRYCIGYNKAHSWKEISKKIGMSIQGCIDIHNRFIEKTRKELSYV